MKSVLCVFLFLILMTGVTFSHNKELYSGLSANNNYFIENKGQWESNILFFAHSNGMALIRVKNYLKGYYYFQMSARGIKNYEITKKGTILLARLKQ